MVGLVRSGSSAGSRRREGGGESQCTDENSESAIAGERWILPCAFVRLLDGDQEETLRRCCQATLKCQSHAKMTARLQ